MAENKIGSFQFLLLKGAVEEPGPAAEKSERFAIDGAEYRQMGRRVVPSTVRSVVDLADAATCLSTYRSYRAAMNGDPVTVYDVNALAYTHVMIRDVRLDTAAAPNGVQPVETPVGGINGGSWLLHCIWTLESCYLP